MAADNNTVSIRLGSGGHAFSEEELAAAASRLNDNPCIVAEFSVETHKTLLVPSEIFDPAAAAGYLAVAGIPCRADEEVISVAAGDMTAVMAADKACTEFIRRTFGDRARFTTPLLTLGGKDAQRTLRIHLCRGVGYFKLCEEGRMRFAEALKTDTTADLLYALQGLDERYGLKGCTIIISGDGAEAQAREVKRYFRKVRCE